MRRLLALIAAALFFAVPAAAHQQKITITTVEHNARTGLLEIVHRIPLHDAEHVLRARGIKDADIVSDMQSRRAFARYVAQRFTLTVAGESLALTLLGSEIESGQLLVYQEHPSPGPGKVLTVHSQIFTEIWASQVNRVNIGQVSSPITVIFHRGDSAKRAVLS
ncbi:MAG: DUF6702 family protein [Erythrobacter sp.]|jgi:predicted deacylase|nr:DUF6702 family protein [Erythrobacter sp.]